MTLRKPYQAKSINGAQRRVRQLQKQLDECHRLLGQFAKERLLLAKLAATGPAFFNPLEAFAAEDVRDKILAQNGMNSDGTFKNKLVKD